MTLAQEVRNVSRVTYLSDAAADFVELQRIRLLSQTPDDYFASARVRNTSGRVIDLIQKGAIAPGSTQDPAYEAILSQLSEAFVQSVGNFSSFDTILNAGGGGFVRVPLRTRVYAVTLGGSAYAVAEADCKPISSLSLSASQLQEWTSIGIVVLANELVRSISAGASDLIANELRRAVGRSSDEVFVNALIGSTGAPTTASTGTTAAAFMSDLADALALISYGATSRLFLLVPPALNRRLMTMRDAGGAIMVGGVVASSIKVVPSDALSDTAILLDASGIAAASDGIIVDKSRNAALALNDNPTSGSGLVSLFQNNLLAARAERRMGLEVARQDCLCLIEGVSTSA